jgi:hypothetical protein
MTAQAELTFKSNAKFLLIRTMKTWSLPRDWKVTSACSRFIFDLGGDTAEAWNRVSSKSRNQIRKGQRSGLTVATGENIATELGSVLHKGIKGLGSPSPPLSFMRRMKKYLGPQVEFVLLRHEGRPIGGAILIFHKDHVSNPWTVTFPRYNEICANSFLYWEIVKLGCERSCRYFDFGRSPNDSPNSRFKLGFGAVQQPLYYYLYPGLARGAVDKGTPGAGIVSSIWKTTPQFISRRLNPYLLKQII